MVAHVADKHCAEADSRDSGAMAAAGLVVQSQPGSPRAWSMAGAGDGGGGMSRRWKLLSMYVRLTMDERRLRKEMWRGLCVALQHKVGRGGLHIDGDGDSGLTQSSSSVSLQLFSNMELDDTVSSGVDVEQGALQWAGVGSQRTPLHP